MKFRLVLADQTLEFQAAYIPPISRLYLAYNSLISHLYLAYITTGRLRGRSP